MVYYNKIDIDKKIKKILIEKNETDYLRFSILCQFSEKYCLPSEIVKMIFKLTYQRVKIKTCDTNVIINTDTTHLFVNTDMEIDEYLKKKKFLNLIKSGIKIIYFGCNYAIMLGLDGMIRYIEFITYKITIIDKNIKFMNGENYQSLHGSCLSFNIITNKNIAYRVWIRYIDQTKYIYEKNRQFCYVQKLFGHVPLTDENVAIYNYHGYQKEVKDIMSVYCITDNRLPSTILLTKKGKILFDTKQYVNDNDNLTQNEDIVMKEFPFKKEIIYLTGYQCYVYVITKDGCAYQWNARSRFLCFRKIWHNVKSIHCSGEFTILLLKNNTVKFIWN